MLYRSASGVFSSAMVYAASFPAGSLSPVSADSSAARLMLSSSRPSAGILSPVASSRISPTTISFWLSITGFPSRSTLQLTSSLILFRASKALALRPSITTVMMTESEMAAKMPTHSKKSASPPVAPRMMLTTSAMTPAAISIKIIGSVAACQMRRNRDSGFAFVSVFAPCVWRLCSACAPVKPAKAFVPRCCSSASLFSVNSFIVRSPQVYFNKKDPGMVCTIHEPNKKTMHGKATHESRSLRQARPDGQHVDLPRICINAQTTPSSEYFQLLRQYSIRHSG